MSLIRDIQNSEVVGAIEAAKIGKPKPTKEKQMSKTIPITKGKFTIVDDEDFEELNQYNWICHTPESVYRQKMVKGVRRMIWMHRFIMKCPDGMEVDHINGNALDNRKSNLRICTHAENMKNIGFSKRNTSGYKGVYWNKSANKWQAQISISGRVTYIGLYDNIEDAASAYNTSAKKNHGDFMRPNEARS